MFIEYAIMADRKESILKHADLWEARFKKIKDRNPTIHSKIRYIQKSMEGGSKQLAKYFPMTFSPGYLIEKTNAPNQFMRFLNNNLRTIKSERLHLMAMIVKLSIMVDRKTENYSKHFITANVVALHISYFYADFWIYRNRPFSWIKRIACFAWRLLTDSGST